MSGTVPVRFEVTDLRRLPIAGSLLALATVVIDLDGVAVTLHGVQILRLPTGRLQARAPRYRTPTGEWAPAVTLPVELERAIGAEVLATFTDPSVDARPIPSPGRRLILGPWHDPPT